MTHFDYKGGVLNAEDVPLDRLAAEVGTPFYLYSSAALEAAYRGFKAALAAEALDFQICYAVKANPHQAIIATFAGLGAGADVVSLGELRRALAAGISPEKIVFAGVGKTEAEMAAALDAGILQFNVESFPELEALDRVAGAKGTSAPIAIRINPDVDARTHAKITTGKSENKFGVDLAHAREAFAKAAELPHLEPKGIAVHIGSQLTEIGPYEDAFAKVAELFESLRAEGIALQRIDLGGGLGVTYRDETPPDPESYAAAVKRTVGRLGVPLIFEPGRLLVAEAGILVTRVIYAKQGATRRFLVVDAAMNDLIRPTLYDAWHDIVPVAEPAGALSPQSVDIVGPICETGDTFARDRALPPAVSGDLLAICSTGAYGATMASTYNSRVPAPEIMVRGADYAVIKPRIDYDALIGQDVVPGWL
jgi:diaminopimelate decarboxylase